MTKAKNIESKQAGPAAAPVPGGTGATEALVPTPAPSEAEIEQLKAQAAKAAEHWDKLLRTAAEFDNFKKRIARERQEAAKYAGEGLLQRLIPVLDNLEMALAAVNGTQGDALKSLQTGITMVYQQFKNALSEAGLKEIDATNQAFNPNFHEALLQEETADLPEGQVVRQVRKGYQLHDRLLRPAGVVVAKKLAEPTAAED